MTKSSTINGRNNQRIINKPGVATSGLIDSYFCNAPIGYIRNALFRKLRIYYLLLFT